MNPVIKDFGKNYGGDVLGHVGAVNGMPWLGSLAVLAGTLAGVVEPGYRPLSWLGNTDVSRLVYIKSNIGGLFFDAVMHTETEERMTITSHPVQSGANISDHAYREPVIINMEITMSDAMASRVPGQFSGVGSRSVNAYTMLRELMHERMPVTVLTRLGSYENMLIESISAPEDVESINSLNINVSLKEVITASVSDTKVSARQWVTGGQNNQGQVQGRPVPRSFLREMEINVGSPISLKSLNQ